MLLRSSLPVSDHQTGASTIPAGTTVVEVDDSGNVLIGPNELVGSQDGANRSGSDSRMVADFAYLADKRRIYTRTVIIAEVNDTPEVAFRRCGGVYPAGATGQSVRGEALGLIHFSGMTERGGWQSRSAQIYARAAEDITSTGAGGELFFATTPLGTASGTTDRLVIKVNGDIWNVTGNFRMANGKQLRWLNKDSTRELRAVDVDEGNHLNVGRDDGISDIQLFGRVLFHDAASNPQRTVAVDENGRVLAKGGIGVGNSKPASTPGAVVGKYEVFDANGASLGFVPVYDQIS